MSFADRMCITLTIFSFIASRLCANYLADRFANMPQIEQHLGNIVKLYIPVVSRAAAAYLNKLVGLRLEYTGGMVNVPVAPPSAEYANTCAHEHYTLSKFNPSDDLLIVSAFFFNWAVFARILWVEFKRVPRDKTTLGCYKTAVDILLVIFGCIPGAPAALLQVINYLWIQLPPVCRFLLALALAFFSLRPAWILVRNIVRARKSLPPSVVQEPNSQRNPSEPLPATDVSVMVSCVLLLSEDEHGTTIASLLVGVPPAYDR